MDIKQYLAASEKRYDLRIKTVIPVDGAAMDRIEHALAKYNPLEFSRPKKTILQRHPLDFKNVINSEVWIIDAVFGLPVSPSVAHEDVRKALDCSETFVVVRDKNEAIEVETRRLNAVADIEAEALRRGLTRAALLSDDPVYVDDDVRGGEKFYGDAYNQGLLAYLGKIEDERRAADEARMEKHLKAHGNMFHWLDLPQPTAQGPDQDVSDFNAHIEGAPRVKPASAPAGVHVSDNWLLGGQQPLAAVVRQLYVDKNGKKLVLSRTLGEE